MSGYNSFLSQSYCWMFLNFCEALAPLGLSLGIYGFSLPARSRFLLTQSQRVCWYRRWDSHTLFLSSLPGWLVGPPDFLSCLLLPHPHEVCEWKSISVLYRFDPPTPFFWLPTFPPAIRILELLTSMSSRFHGCKSEWLIIILLPTLALLSLACLHAQSPSIIFCG